MEPNAYLWLQRDNSRRVELLDRNETVSAAIKAFIDGCLMFCEERGVPWEYLKVEPPVFTIGTIPRILVPFRDIRDPEAPNDYEDRAVMTLGKRFF